MMTGPELPIMCTLSPNGMVERLTRFEELFAASLTGLEREPLLLRLAFEAGTGREAEVRELFAAEQRCCAFLTFGYERTEAGLRVSIAAPAGAGPTLDGFQALAEHALPPQVVARGWTG